MENIREERQVQFAEIWLKSQYGTLYLCPRFGKIKTSIECLKRMSSTNILIIYPIETIKKSWEDDFIKWGYSPDKVTYCSTASLWKLAEKPEVYDLVIMDEVQMFSPANLQEMQTLVRAGNRTVLGLSGTISSSTQEELKAVLNLPILAQYPIEVGIKERVITDYEITVVLTTLDNTDKYIQPAKTKKYFITEKARYDWLTDKIVAIQENLGNLGLLPIQRMHVLKKSRAKLRVTKQLIEKFKGERLLIFCGVTEIADSLGVPTYHSKNKNKELKDKFCGGEGDCLATVDMFEAGVTVKPINKAILNSFDSNPENLAQRVSRLTGFEYDNPNKVASMYIVCTDTVELKWLRKAFEFFDPLKIKYCTIEQI